MRNHILLTAILVCCFSAFLVPSINAEDKAQKFILDNGLTVVLRPIEGCGQVCINTLFRIGFIHEPAEKNGIANLAEHLYTTAATESEPSHTYEELVKNYPLGINAQTGMSFTFEARVFEPEKLEAELAKAAARLKEVKIDEVVFEREKKRVLTELVNMYEKFASLVALNNAANYLLPLGDNFEQFGGKKTDIAGITIQEAQEWLADYYKPGNAVLTIAGEFELEKVKAVVTEKFGSIDKGKELPEPRDIIKRPDFEGDGDILNVIETEQETDPNFVCVALSAPSFEDELYAAFLVLAVRLAQESQTLQPVNFSSLPFVYSPLDRPELLALLVPYFKADNEDEPEKKVTEYIDNKISAQASPDEIEHVVKVYGYLFDQSNKKDSELKGRAYLVALACARFADSKIDGAEIIRRVRTVGEKQIKAAALQFFAANNRIVVITAPGVAAEAEEE